jgi:spore coat protein U-like protein
VTITCTPGATATIGLNGGSQPNGSQSRLFDGGTSYLNYVLYQDASRATPWTNSSPYLLTPPSAPDTSPRTYPVYGRIPAGQTGGGHYTDTVVATVNF